ncbi:hypothetical protein EGR_05241 [Echinococcus granulosus]|uniref:Uncharacterized protein n=1 Tax=Echinococcus granulosus TaxID=6210 RepID=W6UEP6_ECHGR|nr:hypothetical protein EGR_05241 [Echinococcus granulosus]EUB59915.1 hypothetical protein EGR_05241 [Echinococcus granulosus]
MIIKIRRRNYLNIFTNSGECREVEISSLVSLMRTLLFSRFIFPVALFQIARLARNLPHYFMHLNTSGIPNYKILCKRYKPISFTSPNPLNCGHFQVVKASLDKNSECKMQICLFKLHHVYFAKPVNQVLQRNQRRQLKMQIFLLNLKPFAFPSSVKFYCHKATIIKFHQQLIVFRLKPYKSCKKD